MVALGLLLLVAAAVVAVAGVLTNTGSSHLLNHAVKILGYDITGSTGKLLLIGVVIGAVGMLGLNLFLGGAGRGARKKAGRRRELRDTRKDSETTAQERDRLAGRLDHERGARAEAAAGHDTDTQTDTDTDTGSRSDDGDGRRGIFRRTSS